MVRNATHSQACALVAWRTTFVMCGRTWGRHTTACPVSSLALLVGTRCAAPPWCGGGNFSVSLLDRKVKTPLLSFSLSLSLTHIHTTPALPLEAQGFTTGGRKRARDQGGVKRRSDGAIFVGTLVALNWSHAASTLLFVSVRDFAKSGNVAPLAARWRRVRR